MISQAWLWLALYFLIILVILGGNLKYHFINRYTANKWNAISTILGSLGTIGVFVFLGYQINLQTETLQLERRPYVYLHLHAPTVSVWFNPTIGGWFGGDSLDFRNVGKDPATITDVKYMVASDTLGKIDLVGWFKEAYGGFPDPRTLFPGQEDAEVQCHPQISSADKKPRLMYIGAVVSYVGPKPGRKYWYKFSQTYVIEIKKARDRKGRETVSVGTYALTPDHDWDKNANDQAPDLKEPDWKFYLSKSAIRTLGEE